ncbi:golgin subfamily A member 2 [Diachasma alloeum]|uniref:golgin subfamily A member 2 n=1 Tax=Diachasma alloeum TaxID=454923 RepID=UPI0007381100|nr:golgin subfamily A member 2 [Diachasma alloeum]
MNKTEKLLAARRKLKEFQQHKLNHNHHQAEAGQLQQETTKNNVPAVPPGSPQDHPQKSADSAPATPTPHIEPPPPQPPCDPLESPPNPTTTESPPQSLPPPPESPVEPQKHEETPHTPEPLQNPFDPHQPPNPDPLPSPPLLQNGTLAAPTPPNGSPEDSPSLQKQHLLQMASEVANALVDSETETSSPAIHSDLEYRNHFLTTCLDEQKRLVNQLHIQVSQYSSRVSELEALLSTKEAEHESKFLRELNPLKEQLKVHAQTTGILVAEKAELSSAIAQYQTISQQKSSEVEDLCLKLKTSNSKTTELERELSHLKNATEEMRKNYHQLQSDNAHLEKKFSDLKKDKEEQQLETAELRQELNLKNTELSSLHRELNEKNNLLSLSELKIQQLTGPQEMQALEGHHQTQTVLEQQLSQLRETLKSVNNEKEETSKHYENYVKQLDSRYDKVLQELEAAKSKIGESEKREESLVQRLSVMEQQYQREKQRVESLLPLEAHEEKINHLTKSVDVLVVENETLQSSIREKDAEIEAMKEELHHLQELKDQNVESLKLASALESEQLGASRAVSQNQELKAQLNEMHDAFVMLSNSKLDLTEQLQGERTIGRKLNAELNRVEDERDELREELKRKDAVIEELEKDRLQTAQVADQMQHYQVQYSQNRTLQQELQSTLSALELLKRENQTLIGKLHALGKDSGDVDEGISEGIEGEEVEAQVEVPVVVVEKKNSEVQTNGEGLEGEILSEPLKKLEMRFKETMERVAELTDEKQKLEHLVLQLQGETETIGEYITLYQKQRAILQKKAQEKEQTFRQLVEQRNQQQVQLHQLKVLVAELLRTQTGGNSGDHSVPEDPLLSGEERIRGEERNTEKSPEDPKSDGSTMDLKSETTSKILDLLTEIKDCKDTCSLEPNFHPCLWCSGKLITV